MLKNIILLFGLLSASAMALDVKLDLQITSGLKPMLVLQTNLPPKMSLVALLVNPVLNGGDGFLFSMKSSVDSDGVVKFGPFTKAGKPMQAGIYHVMITSGMIILQPVSVQKILGPHGENMSGDGVQPLSAIPGVSNLGNGINLDIWADIH